MSAAVPFKDALAALCATELPKARKNPEAMGEMIERLVNSLAFTIAVASSGNPEGMQEMLTGVESHLYERATEHARFASLFEAIRADENRLPPSIRRLAP